MRPSAFIGPLIPDLVEWGLAGQLFGGTLAFAGVELKSFAGEPIDKTVKLEMAGRAALRLAIFLMAVVLIGHGIVLAID